MMPQSNTCDLAGQTGDFKWSSPWPSHDTKPEKLPDSVDA